MMTLEEFSRLIREHQAGVRAFVSSLGALGDTGMVRLLAEEAEEKRLGLRMKEKPPEGSLVVEYLVHGATGTFIEFWLGNGCEWSDETEYSGKRKYHSSAIVLRRELVRLKPGAR